MIREDAAVAVRRTAGDAVKARNKIVPRDFKKSEQPQSAPPLSKNISFWKNELLKAKRHLVVDGADLGGDAVVKRLEVLFVRDARHELGV